MEDAEKDHYVSNKHSKKKEQLESRMRDIERNDFLKVRKSISTQTS